MGTTTIEQILRMTMLKELIDFLLIAAIDHSDRRRRKAARRAPFSKIGKLAPAEYEAWKEAKKAAVAARKALKAQRKELRLARSQNRAAWERARADWTKKRQALKAARNVLKAARTAFIRKVRAVKAAK